ncbi:MAG: flagellar hook-basal body complex protein [Calditrichia bacterium]
MGLMRSLYAGVSGLRNHQVMMDVIGNNLSNVNTIGFKSGRASFSETFAQTLRGTTQPLANLGGTNPMQVGLGMSLANIDTLFSQGNIETTGQTTDLAIQGEGFFVTSDGQQNYYTRAGNFQFDGSGRLIMPGSGVRVQGYLANSAGVIEPGSPLTDIVLPFGKKIGARATTEATFAGNLDASAKPQGNILESGPLYAVEAGDSDIQGLRANGFANDKITGLTPNSTEVVVKWVDANGVEVSKSYKYVADDNNILGNGAFNSLKDLMDEVNADFTGQNLSVAINSTGALEFTNGSGAAVDLTLTSNSPVLESALHGGTTNLTAGAVHTTDEFSHVASQSDLLSSLRNEQGQSLGLSATDVITLNGLKGGEAISPVSYTINANSTYGEFAAQVGAAFGLTNEKGVEIGSEDGALKINGDGGKIYELSALDFRATDSGGTILRSEFNSIFDSTPGHYSQLQKAEDVQQSASMTVYDSQGNAFDLNIVFTKDVTDPNQWRWEVVAPEPAAATGGSTGYLEFNDDGSLKAFKFDDGSSSLQIDPGTGGNNLISIELNPGELGGFDGITQLSGANTTVFMTSQDGYGMGYLDQITIDEAGRITGGFTNGIVQALGQLALASFNNPGGMTRTEDNLFEVSGNSGSPVISTAGQGIHASIISGALEQSNVDLAEQFTNMIVAQRGFQASARTISTSDDMLAEVTNLKR